jgi:16S rRNA (cytosine1402-N4)-methyltransferase
VVVDGTVGAGGHAAELARHIGPSGHLFGLDRDAEMLALAAEATRGLPLTLAQAPYSEIGDVLQRHGRVGADAILLDLGLSSDQLAWTQRGFSFSQDGPLDMRFDARQSWTASEIINSESAEALADIFYHFGEERFSRRIARRIVEHREQVGPIESTGQLAQIVRRAIPGKRGAIDPATRVFQALRIAVNDELTHLEIFLKQVPDWLVTGGRVAVISFHSLEDRRVKHSFRDDPLLHVLTRKPITGSPEEIRGNPRARSAKLRVAERCAPTSPSKREP